MNCCQSSLGNQCYSIVAKSSLGNNAIAFSKTSCPFLFSILPTKPIINLSTGKFPFQFLFIFLLR